MLARSANMHNRKQKKFHPICDCCMQMFQQIRLCFLDKWDVQLSKQILFLRLFQAIDMLRARSNSSGWGPFSWIKSPCEIFLIALKLEAETSKSNGEALLAARPGAEELERKLISQRSESPGGLTCLWLSWTRNVDSTVHTRPAVESSAAWTSDLTEPKTQLPPKGKVASSLLFRPDFMTLSTNCHGYLRRHCFVPMNKWLNFALMICLPNHRAKVCVPNTIMALNFTSVVFLRDKTAMRLIGQLLRWFQLRFPCGNQGTIAGRFSHFPPARHTVFRLTSVPICLSRQSVVPPPDLSRRFW